MVLIRQFLIGIAGGMVLFLPAAGLSLVISGMNVINFAQGAFFMLGAFLCFTITHFLNFWWALLLGPLVVAILGGLAEFLLHPIYGKSMLYQLIVTMGIVFIMIDGMRTIWGPQLKTVPAPAFFQSSVPLLGLDFPTYYMFIIIVSGLFAIGVWLMFEKTKLGMIFRAIISDREMVGNLGINVALLFNVMFMFGVWLGGIAGVLMAPIMGIIAQNSVQVLFSALVILVIGGLTSMRGAFFAALIVGIVNAVGAMLLPWFYTLIPAALMIIVLLIKPEGLFAKSEESSI